MSIVTLERLIEEAEKYGSIFIYSNEPATDSSRYRCEIRLIFTPHFTLEFMSDSGMTIRDAVASALLDAVQFVESVNQTSLPDTSKTRFLLSGLSAVETIA